MQLVGMDGEEGAQLGPRITVIARWGWVVPGTSKAFNWWNMKVIAYLMTTMNHLENPLTSLVAFLQIHKNVNLMMVPEDRSGDHQSK